ncbi:MAG: DNA-directed RNA polymerase subunit beta [Candidatus Magasanikbacteria bacterium GW2011_GWD2_43_18]|uniref:DNA-directed RNA polymerase subunit beta n=1 Tax=Candidatus Magasanikbacteria bacterium GW2011_GWE2_42_7 TaxID=1619052 RepID=A0A0G1BFY8_9BACT|nr:MAG: DNA-directed RNA polymerase subunit beta [Candidatus Magasanikbacteria bacterium GW2011_GWC2_42_27]KKS72197.1 MAG: DNA-directed RNA polymerase subunit beta [Candidatus Magasanikbacteria bacterium GW2011_GWE2_42_7]KKT04923.1 MAG: DNA-directed RNA polymerase subunit beta [Candidatus Magasanikbacteria bacterium GW2011_GWD2_43_18]HBB37800.1 DNA-directed RNA polymerase subunit beta [Candidatus Magasanikbacteria bacterium]HCC13374.1 DNA-directed RNA polymerase subunit beta [Candidatus Magasan
MPIYKRQKTTVAERKFFTKLKSAIEAPDLIETQKASYHWFFDVGIKELFEEISPVKDFTGRDLELYFEDYTIDEPKFDEVVCREKNVTFEAPLRVKVRLVNKRTKTEDVQEIYLGDIPIMTDRGTFMVNGIERVVVSQLIRSAGAFFTESTVRGRKYYGAKIIPNRGAWIEIETDQNNVIWVKVDRKRKVAATSLLRAFGMSDEAAIIKAFEDVNTHPNIDYVEATLKKDAAENEDEGLIEVYKRIRPGDLATADNAKSLIHSMFFNFDRYDFGRVGVYKLDKKFDLGLGGDDYDQKEQRVLSPEKLLLVLKEVVRLNVTQEDADDIDHLGNRRIRAVGELVQNRFRVGMARMERIIRDRMSTYELESLAPNKLINARPVIGAIREFFMSSQLSQFMDQVNPLAELEHKRRVSALGPGGLSRDRAGFEVRDVHTTHYGRICPIATPEGPNIGLVGHLASYAKINSFGFVEAPYRKVVRDVPNQARFTEGEYLREDISGIGKAGEQISKDLAKKLEEKKDIQTVGVMPRVTNDIVYLNSFQEEKVTTASATTPMNEHGILVGERIPARVHGEPSTVAAHEIEYIDIASNQILSVATSMIPFLEHDDATRALMGTNMQRQAVPCIKPDAPLVGTGMEKIAAENSGHVLFADADGDVTELDGSRIVITDKNKKKYTYNMNKYVRSNASSSINQRPVVTLGQKVKKGDALCNGPSINNGELALGQNVLVAYMVWDGYNYEDAIIISERLVQQDRYTSIHVEDYATDVRETKLGPEVVTSDIPNVSEEKLKNLDTEGVIRIGAEVHSGDILVGKITPKGETELTPEERLLRAIFGEKARDVRDSSLYLEHGEHGKVTDIRVFSADEGDKLQPGVIKQVQVTVADMRKLQVGDKMAGRHGNKGVISRVVPVADMPFLEDGTPVDIILSPLGVISRMNLGQLLETHLGLAANALGYRVATPVLNGITEKQIVEELQKAGFPADAQSQLYDGRTGEPMDHKTTVGYSYMLKLNHMIEDKMHQRSIGPYSLITQQPLGGKAQFGGQRFGEMEVWALEAYGAAHTLQEILTIKSDDVPGRSKAYEAIIKGNPITRVNLPESFNVLVRELKGLALDVKLMKHVGDEYIPADEIANVESSAYDNDNERND